MVKDGFSGLAADFYDADIQKLITHDMTSAWIFMGIMQKNDLMSVVMM
jgi:hypothetical protein